MVNMNKQKFRIIIYLRRCSPDFLKAYVANLEQKSIGTFRYTWFTNTYNNFHLSSLILLYIYLQADKQVQIYYWLLELYMLNTFFSLTIIFIFLHSYYYTYIYKLIAFQQTLNLRGHPWPNDTTNHHFHTCHHCPTMKSSCLLRLLDDMNRRCQNFLGLTWCTFRKIHKKTQRS